MIGFIADYWNCYVLDLANEIGGAGGMIFSILLLIGVPMLFILGPIIMFIMALSSSTTPEERERLRMKSYECPRCGYSDPFNEYDTIYGEASGKCRCRRCGHHWNKINL